VSSAQAGARGARGAGVKILVADDHRLFRGSLKSLLEARGHTVVGEAGDGAQAIELAERLRPDLVLMDLSMPGLNGLEATRRLVAHAPSCRVVILTASTDDAMLFEGIKAGAQGYVPKDIDAEQFFVLLDTAARGEPALTPDLARKVLAELRAPSRRRKGGDPDALTEREQAVLDMMVAGKTSNRELAELLGLSENTVKFHVRNILDKLQLHNRAQAVGHALRGKGRDA
jgi:DNA-binding NarL/FixJ family response regulator